MESDRPDTFRGLLHKQDNSQTYDYSFSSNLEVSDLGCRSLNIIPQTLCSVRPYRDGKFVHLQTNRAIHDKDSQ